MDGRHIPLRLIREKTLKKLVQHGVVREKNTKRHLIVWSDHSSVINKGHLLITVKTMYNPKQFYTDEEMLDRTGKSIDVQQLVERPQVLILAKCQDSIAQKTTFVEARNEDIQDLKTPTVLDDGNDFYRFIVYIDYSVFVSLYVTSFVYVYLSKKHKINKKSIPR